MNTIASGGIMARLHYRWWMSFVAAGILATIAGCSGGSALDTAMVTGVVTLDGEPVEGATVMFRPVTEGQGAPATGTTDASGKYTLTTVAVGEAAGAAGAGALPGEYYVGVTKTVSAAQAQEEALMKAYESGDSQAVAKLQAPSGQAPKVEHVVPQKYNNPEASGLTVTVTDGENDIPLELSSS
jgi:hypothetical protein